MQLQINHSIKRLTVVIFSFVIIAGAIVAYLIVTHEDGLTVYVENTARRDSLKSCLLKAEVAFDVLENNTFKAKPESVDQMKQIWTQFQNSESFKIEMCKKYN